MSYQALYRKYRSQRFDEMVGQEVVARTLKNAIITDQISHAYLFSGPRGTGKTSAAKIFAKAINCPNQTDGEPCNTCEICQAVTNGSLEDVIEIKVLHPEDSVYRELIMVKVRANKTERTEIISVADIFRAKIVDVEKDSLMVELTGNGSKVDAFLELLEGYEILELARTGITGLQRGIKDVTVIDQEGNINTL